MTDVTLLRGLGIILIAAAAIVIVARAARIPSIVAYIVAGLLLGPVTGLIAVTEAVELISEAGIALLLFVVGLELSLDRIRDVGRVAVVAGIGQVAFTAAGGFAVSALLGFGAIEALFIAVALTFSSTVVVVKLLDQKGELNALYGRIAVGIFLVQDLVVIVVLTFLAGLGRPEAYEVGAIVRGIVVAFGGMALLLAGALLASRWALPPIFGWVATSLETMFVWSLCWLFLFVLGAEVLGLSLEIGAFLAGISLAQLPYNHELRRRVHPLMNFFIAVFFVALGIRMQLGGAAEHGVAALALSLFVLIGNPFIFMLLIARYGYGERTAFLTSVTVAQISEFSFIFAALGLSAGLIDESILSLIAVIGLITIAASSYMILYNHELYGWMQRTGVLRVFGAAATEPAEERPERSGHIIVVGMNALGRRLVDTLAARGEQLLAIDTDPRKLADLPCDTLLGSADYLSVLEEANLPRAKMLVSALQIEDTNRLLAHRCRVLGVPSSIHALDQQSADELRELGADHVIRSKHAGVQRIAGELRAAGVIEG